VDRARGF